MKQWAKLALNNPEGWIIDLRLNGGGNIRPMLAGMAMFFTPGIKGYYLDPNDTATEALSFRDGDFQIEGITQAAIKQKIPGFKNIKVAVLIGAGTGSSGEGGSCYLSAKKEHQGLLGKLQPAGPMLRTALSLIITGPTSLFL
ncbi:MAG: S41 family peptidase [Bacteroidota bacterium]